MLNGHADALADEFGNNHAVAMLGMPLEAEQAGALAGFHQRGELVELLDGRRSGELGLIDAAQIVIAAGPCRLPSLGRCAEPTQVQIIDTSAADAGRQQRLGKASTARGGDGAHIHQQLDTGARQRVQHGIGGYLLVADGEKRGL